MPHPVNLVLLALIVGMVIYHGRLYLLHQMAFRLGFLGFWGLLLVELFTEERWLVAPMLGCLGYGIWKRRRVGKAVLKMLDGDENGPQISL